MGWTNSSKTIEAEGHTLLVTDYMEYHLYLMQEAQGEDTNLVFSIMYRYHEYSEIFDDGAVLTGTRYSYPEGVTATYDRAKHVFVIELADSAQKKFKVPAVVTFNPMGCRVKAKKSYGGLHYRVLRNGYVEEFQAAWI